MGKTITAAVAKFGLLGGDKLYQVRARATLPYLVRYAKAGRTVYYSDLAKELNIPNARSFNFILGAIGNVLLDIAHSPGWQKIPPIQCIVISKSTELPGDGVGWFISDLKDFNKLSKKQKKNRVQKQLEEIFAYQDWDLVLNYLSLDPLELDLEEKLEKAKSMRGGGESESHRKFKEFVSKNPGSIGLNHALANGLMEQPLPSGDTLDILFTDKELKIGVEVKSQISGTEDILRGIFQCVKYKHIIEAEQIVEGILPNSRVILALEGKLPEKLVMAKNLLDIEVIDGITIMENAS